MGYTETVPLEYAEFVLSREMKWGDIDQIPAERVDHALAFFGLEGRYRKIRERPKAN